MQRSAAQYANAVDRDGLERFRAERAFEIGRIEKFLFLTPITPELEIVGPAMGTKLVGGTSTPASSRRTFAPPSHSSFVTTPPAAPEPITQTSYIGPGKLYTPRSLSKQFIPLFIARVLYPVPPSDSQTRTARFSRPPQSQDPHLHQNQPPQSQFRRPSGRHNQGRASPIPLRAFLC